jgi:hypothetical protein
MFGPCQHVYKSNPFCESLSSKKTVLIFLQGDSVPEMPIPPSSLPTTLTDVDATSAAKSAKPEATSLSTPPVSNVPDSSSSFHQFSGPESAPVEPYGTPDPTVRSAGVGLEKPMEIWDREQRRLFFHIVSEEEAEDIRKVNFKKFFYLFAIHNAVG